MLITVEANANPTRLRQDVCGTTSGNELGFHRSEQPGSEPRVTAEVH